jgi:hypothetical protein
VDELAALAPTKLASSAACVIRGTITAPSLTGIGKHKRGFLGIRVRTNYTSAAVADSNSVILLEFLSGPDAGWQWENFPPLTPDQDVILFLDHTPSGHFTLHGGLYGMWSVSGDSARVSCPTMHADGPLTILATIPTDSLLAIIHER